MQAVASPYFFFRRRNSYSNVITNRVPVAPNGCPNAIAPPLTLTLLRSRPSSFSTDKYCVAKASFRLTGGTPTVYASSPGVRRTHCGRCGSPIGYESDRHPDQIDLYVGTLDDPSIFQPGAAIFTRHRQARDGPVAGVTEFDGMPGG